ncbi:MAG: hypothetical protein EPO62_05485 [Candidatus Nitrosotenuis sp.]|nr:MAG: hypothetical protein EPO62_05485 [Candidatus Nitrosotenuis sp.]
MNKPLFAILIGLVLVTSVASQSSFGENAGCRRDCEAPTFGNLDDGKKMVQSGLVINDKSFDATQYDQVVPTMTVAAGQPLRVKMTVYENSGADALQHVSFTISDYKDERHQNDKASISWDRDFTGEQKVNVVDFDKMFDGVKANATSIDAFTTSVVFTFKFQKSIDPSSIIIDAWDNSKNSRKNIFVDAIKVEDKSLEKAIQNAVEKKIAEKKAAKDQSDKSEKEKSSEKSKDKSKKSTKKPQIAKGKKKVQLPRQYEY